MRHALFITAFILLALPVAGCVAQTAPPHGLAGSEWRITAIDGQTPAAPDRARMALQKDRLSANVGCNSMSGPWRVEKSRLIAGPLMQTKMFCEGPIGEQEQAASALLVAAPTLELDGARLTLRSSGHSLTLERIDATGKDR
ncbi:MAG TPA: META domain-containing protein [Sphingomonadaceae bacterium]|nr:META domain-containing protein [Sphingomonadaceae bacterium]